MVWIPDWQWEAIQQAKGGGSKGGNKGGWSGGNKGGNKGSWSQPQVVYITKGKGGKGKGKGKGKGRRPSKLDPAKTLWVGNIPEGIKYPDLKAHCDQAGVCKWAEVYEGKGKGTGALGYASAEEAAAALPQLNGSLLNGHAIEVDVWEKGSK